MVAKKADNPSVDMDRIKAMMGPLPNEGAPEPANKKSKKEDNENSSDGELSEAAAEANAALKAMSPDLGISRIEKIADKEILDAAGQPIEPIVENPSPVTSPTNSSDSAPDKEDPQTASAVDDIVAHEGDVVLAAEDEKRGKSEDVKKPAKKGKFKAWIAKIWAKPAGKWGIIGGGVALLLAIGLIPYSRYFILNSVGVRSSLTVRVLDNGTQLPIKNVQVSAAGVVAQTNDKGEAKLEHVKLGPANLLIEKRAFADVKKPIVVGWGSNPLGDFRVSAVGTQYGVIVSDFLSGKPIEGVQVSSGDGNAVSDKEGKMLMALDIEGKADSDVLEFTITSEHYRTETIKVTVSNKQAQLVKLVPSRKNVFISKRDGKYDVYAIDIDGKNEKRLVAGTGIERDDVALLQDKSGTYAALVATRENTKNGDSYLLSTLYVFDIRTGGLSKIDQSEQIGLVGWSDDGHLAYVKVAAGASAANPKRGRLMSFNSKSGTTGAKELAAANYFTEAVPVGSKIYFAPSDSQGSAGKVGLFSIGFDGSGLTTISDKIVWSLLRTAYDTFSINSSNTWLTYKIGGTATAPGTPSTQNRTYADNGDGKTSLWVDQRDGKGVLLSFDKATSTDKTLLTRAGLTLPLYWLSSNTVVFRVSDGKETADYAYNIEGGDAKKIVDVNQSGYSY